MRMLRNETLRKGLSLLLVLLLCAGLLPMGAWAEPEQGPAVPITAGLYYRRVEDRGNAGFVYDPGRNEYIGSLTLTPGQTEYVQFWYYNGTEVTAVAFSDLSVTENQLVITSVSSDSPSNVVSITAGSAAVIGESYSITYNKDATLTATFSVSYALPEVGFYSAAEGGSDNYLSEWKYTGSNGTIYLISKEDAKIYDAAAENDSSAISVATTTGQDEQINSESHTGAKVWQVTLDPSKLDGNSNGFGVSYKIKRDNGNEVELESRRERINFTYAVPGIYLRQTDWQNNAPAQDTNRSYESSLTLSKGNISYYEFFYCADPSAQTPVYTPITVGDGGLSVSGEAVTASNYDGSGTFVELEAKEFGSATLSYTPQGGPQVTFPVTVGLPEVGFYKDASATDTNYISEWDYTATGNDKIDTVYILTRDGYELNGNDAVTLDGDNQSNVFEISETNIITVKNKLDDATLGSVGELSVKVKIKETGGGNWTNGDGWTIRLPFTGVEGGGNSQGGNDRTIRIGYTVAENNDGASGDVYYYWDTGSFGNENKIDFASIQEVTDGDNQVKYFTISDMLDGDGPHTLHIKAVPASGSGIDTAHTEAQCEGQYAQMTGITTAQGYSCEIDPSKEYRFMVCFTLSSLENEGGISYGTVSGNGNQKNNYSAAKTFIESSLLAYYTGETVDTAKLKTYAIAELWNLGFSNDGRHTADFDGMFASRAAFTGAFGEVARAASKDHAVTPQFADIQNAPTSLAAYEVTVTLPDNSTATATIYALTDPSHFVITSKKGQDVTWNLVDGGYGGGGDVIFYAEYDETIADSGLYVFGNGVGVSGDITMGNGSGKALHVSQEHTGIGGDETIPLINCRAGVSHSENIVKLKGDRSSDMFGFGHFPYYELGEGKTAEIYYGVTRLKFENVYKDRTVSVAADTTRIDASCVEWVSESSELVINTNYDLIPVIVTLTEGQTVTTYPLTLCRVGLQLDKQTVGETSIDEDARTGFSIMHGTGQTTWYDSGESSGTELVIGSFYGYSADDVNVNLFVTVTYTNGTVEHRVVTPQVNGTSITWTGDHRTVTDQSPHLDGTDQYINDYILWSGSNANSVRSISAIAFVPRDDGSFGGAKVGGGTPAVWTPGYSTEAPQKLD